MTGDQKSTLRMGALALAAGSLAVPFGAAHADVITTYVGATDSSTSVNISFQGVTVFIANGSLNGSNATDVVDATNFVEGASVPIKLGSGVSVGPTAFEDPEQSAGFIYFGSSPFYAGLEVNAGGSNYFGYTEYTSNDTLQGYAFESTPGNGIITADIEGSAVPEPASMALLAAGVAGVGIIRRRRSVH